MPTAKANDLPEAPNPANSLSAPKNRARTRLVQAFRQGGFSGLARLALPLAHIWAEKILVNFQSRLPFAYRRWQILIEKHLPPLRSMPPTGEKVAFVFARRIDQGLAELVRGIPDNSLSWFYTTQTIPDLPHARCIAADNEGEFLCRCAEQAATEGIEWLIFTHPQAVHASQLVPGLLAQAETGGCIYWDEDHLSSRGERTSPFFKPDWSPELWLSIDLLDTFALRLNVFNSGLPQLSLSHLKAWTARTQNPYHLPRVWTHIRQPGAAEEQSRLAHHATSVSCYLTDLGLTGINTQITTAGVLKTSWTVRPEKVSIIIPTRNNLNYLQRCLQSLLKITNYPDYEIILVDNDSSDPDVLAYYSSLIEEGSSIRILPYPAAFNFSRACNLGATVANGDLLLFLNNDVEIIEANWLDEMVRMAQLPGVGIVGACLFYPDGRLQHSGIILGMTGHANHVGIQAKVWQNSPYGPADALRNCSAVTGACMLVRTGVFQSIGGFKEDYRLVFNDVEVCLRAIRAGWRIVLTPYANLIHYEGRSRARTIPPEDMRLAALDFASWIEKGDPYYNPNLTLAITRPVFRSRLEMPALQRMNDLTTILGWDDET